jgi:hypothetical protein
VIAVLSTVVEIADADDCFRWTVRTSLEPHAPDRAPVDAGLGNPVGGDMTLELDKLRSRARDKATRTDRDERWRGMIAYPRTHHSLAPEVFLRPVLTELGAECPTRALYLIDSAWDDPSALDAWLPPVRACLRARFGATDVGQ